MINIQDKPWRREGGVLFSPLLADAGVVHGFTLAGAGDFAGDEGAAERLPGFVGASSLRLLRQVHGVRIADPMDEGEALPEADAWAGRAAPDELLGVRTADCLPVLMAHPPTGRVAAVHAGWRSAVAGIHALALEKLAAPPSEVVTALGPAIGPCCFEVGKEVVVAAKGGERFATDKGGGKYLFDLAGFVAAELIAAGLGPENIDRAGLCTMCGGDDFFSHRKDGTPRRHCSFVGQVVPEKRGLGRAGPVKRVGLTGSIGSGKSTAARLLKERGAGVVDADALARRALEPGTEAAARAVEAFGAGILDGEGRIDRKALAEVVFADAEARGVLEQIVHPWVDREARRLMDEHLAADPGGFVVYDVPLLFETGMEDRFDLVVAVFAGTDRQLARLGARGDVAADDAERRMAAQLGERAKARLADFVLDNRGGEAALGRQADRLASLIRDQGAEKS